VRVAFAHGVRAAFAGAHLDERAQKEALTKEVETLRREAAAEKEAHGHAVRQYVAEVELRSQLQAQIAEERSTKEHAVFLRSMAEKKILQLQVQYCDCATLCGGYDYKCQGCGLTFPTASQH
jgi:hypothetical protein